MKVAGFAVPVRKYVHKYVRKHEPFVKKYKRFDENEVFAYKKQIGNLQTSEAELKQALLEISDELN